MTTDRNGHTHATHIRTHTLFIPNNLPLNRDLQEARFFVDVGEERLLLLRLPAVTGEVAANATVVALPAPPSRARSHAARTVVVVEVAAADAAVPPTGPR